jgi:hypothetical protein
MLFVKHNTEQTVENNDPEKLTSQSLTKHTKKVGVIFCKIFYCAFKYTNIVRRVSPKSAEILTII